MRPKLVHFFALCVALLVGLYAGYVLSIKYYVPVYETPMITINSMFLSAMDRCLERNDEKCFRLAFGKLIDLQRARAEAILEHPLASDMDQEIKAKILELSELGKKYDPDA